MTDKIEALTRTGSGVAWLASSNIGPRIVFAPEGEGNEGGEGEGAAEGGDEGQEGAEGADAGKDKGKDAAGQDGAGKQEGAAGEGGEEGKGKGAEGAQGEGADDWRSKITDEQLRDFAGRFASPADLAKAAFDLRKANSSMIKVPGKDASEEEVAKFRKAIGVPEKPEEYKFEMPEGAEATEADEKFHERMANVMHEAGIPASQASALNKAWNDLTAEALAEHERVTTEAREASEASLKKEWGKDFDANKNLALRVIRSHASPEFVDLLENTEVNGTKLGDHPELVKVFGNLGRRMDESGFIGTVGAEERSDVQGQIDQLMRDNPPGTDKYKSDAVQKKLRELNEQLHGSGPIVGTQGRAA